MSTPRPLNERRSTLFESRAMTYSRGEMQEADTEELRKLRQYAIYVAGGLIIAPLIVGVVERMGANEPILPDPAVLYAYIATLFLILMWIWSTDKELAHLGRWLDTDEYYPPSSIVEVLAIMIVSTGLALLVLSIPDLLMYSVMFVAYSVGTIAVSLYMLSEIETAVTKSHDKLSEALEANERLHGETKQDRIEKRVLDANDEALKALARYYFSRPQKLRWIIIALISAIILALVVGNRQHWFGLTTVRIPETLLYVGLGTLILVSEAWIGFWRYERDRRIMKATRSLRAANRERD